MYTNIFLPVFSYFHGLILKIIIHGSHHLSCHWQKNLQLILRNSATYRLLTNLLADLGNNR